MLLKDPRRVLGSLLLLLGGCVGRPKPCSTFFDADLVPANYSCAPKTALVLSGRLNPDGWPGWDQIGKNIAAELRADVFVAAVGPTTGSWEREYAEDMLRNALGEGREGLATRVWIADQEELTGLIQQRHPC